MLSRERRDKIRADCLAARLYPSVDLVQVLLDHASEMDAALEAERVNLHRSNEDVVSLEAIKDELHAALEVERKSGDELAAFQKAQLDFLPCECEEEESDDDNHREDCQFGAAVNLLARHAELRRKSNGTACRCDPDSEGRHEADCVAERERRAKP